jgi:hypothetical protein
LASTLVVAALVLVSYSRTAAADTSPGDVITAANRERVRGLIPDEVYPFAVENFSDLHMTIVPTEDYPVHPKYVEATVKFACQAGLDENGQLVNYTAGQPFPYSAWAVEATGHACDLTPDDPQFALKLAWNVNFRWLGGEINMPHWGQSFWREQGDNTWRVAQGGYRRTYFSHRADLLPEATSLDPGTDIEWAEYTEMVAPFDLRGTAFLVFRYRNSREKPDDAWSYVPTLRRVRRVSTAEKADSIQGSDFTLEDFMLFSGYVWDQEWRFGGESTLLAALDTRRTCFPSNVPGRKPDRVGILGDREDFDACRFGPFKALPLVDETWQKRTAVRLDQTPRRDGHPYRKRVLWYDKQTLAPFMGLSYDREGNPFRLMWYLGNWSETAGTEASKGRFAILIAASAVVNLRDGVSNLSQSFGTNGSRFTAEEARKYFDSTRLKQRH